MASGGDARAEAHGDGDAAQPTGPPATSEPGVSRSSSLGATPPPRAVPNHENDIEGAATAGGASADDGPAPDPDLTTMQNSQKAGYIKDKMSRMLQLTCRERAFRQRERVWAGGAKPAPPRERAASAHGQYGGSRRGISSVLSRSDPGASEDPGHEMEASHHCARPPAVASNGAAAPPRRIAIKRETGGLRAVLATMSPADGMRLNHNSAHIAVAYHVFRQARLARSGLGVGSGDGRVEGGAPATQAVCAPAGADADGAENTSRASTSADPPLLHGPSWPDGHPSAEAAPPSPPEPSQPQPDQQVVPQQGKKHPRQPEQQSPPKPKLQPHLQSSPPALQAQPGGQRPLRQTPPVQRVNPGPQLAQPQMPQCQQMVQQPYQQQPYQQQTQQYIQPYQQYQQMFHPQYQQSQQQPQQQPPLPGPPHTQQQSRPEQDPQRQEPLQSWTQQPSWEQTQQQARQLLQRPAMTTSHLQSHHQTMTHGQPMQHMHSMPHTMQPMQPAHPQMQGYASCSMQPMQAMQMQQMAFSYPQGGAAMAMPQSFGQVNVMMAPQHAAMAAPLPPQCDASTALPGMGAAVRYS